MTTIFIHNPNSLLPPYKFYTFKYDDEINKLNNVIKKKFPILTNVPLKFYNIKDISKLKYTWNYNKYCSDNNLTQVSTSSQNILVNYNHSQHNEDSILYKIFNTIGTTNKYFVDIGCRELEFTSNVYILRQNGWKGFGCDPNTTSKQLSDGTIIVQSFANPDNFESLLEQNNVPINFDFLSIDIDGDDYYLFESLNKYKPRVLCIELDADVYNKDYVAPFGKASRNRSSSSIIKMNKLCEKKGYKLVYNNGGNGFFVLENEYHKFLPININEYITLNLNMLKQDLNSKFNYKHDLGLLKKMLLKFKQYQNKNPQYNDWYIPTVDILNV